MKLDVLWWIGWLATATLLAVPLALVPALGLVAGVVAWAMLAPWTSLVGLAVLHRAMPDGKPGTFRMATDFGATRWAMKGWAPSVWLTLFQPLFFLSPGFQRLALRAFGARLGEGAWLTSRTVVREPHHVRVGARSMIGECAHLATSLQPRPGILIVAPISIGDDTLVGAYCHLGAGATIGSRCVLEHAVCVAPRAVIEDDVRIGAATVVYASARVGRGATIGKHCVILARSTVADGASVPDGTMYGRRSRDNSDDAAHPFVDEEDTAVIVWAVQAHDQGKLT